MSLCIKHGKQSLHDSLSPILENQELRPLVLTRVLGLAPFHFSDKELPWASEDEQPPSLKLRKEEGRWAQHLLSASSFITHASQPSPPCIAPTPFSQAGLLLIHPIAPHGKILISFHSQIKHTERHDKPTDITWGRRQQAANHPACRKAVGGWSWELPHLPVYILGASMAPSPHSLLYPAQNQPTCYAVPELGRLHRSWGKDFPFIPTGKFGKSRPGNNHRTVVTHCLCQWKESLLPSAPLLPPGIATKTTTPTSKEVMQGCEAGILSYKIQEWWERAASLTASASLAC